MKLKEWLNSLFYREHYLLERFTDDGSVTYRGVFRSKEEVQEKIMEQALTLRQNLMKIGYRDSDFITKDIEGYITFSWNDGRDYVRWKTTHNVYTLFYKK